ERAGERVSVMVWRKSTDGGIPRGLMIPTWSWRRRRVKGPACGLPLAGRVTVSGRLGRREEQPSQARARSTCGLGFVAEDEAVRGMVGLRPDRDREGVVPELPYAEDAQAVGRLSPTPTTFVRGGQPIQVDRWLRVGLVVEQVCRAAGGAIGVRLGE